MVADSFQITKLRFEDVDLVGREKELEIITDCLQKASSVPVVPSKQAASASTGVPTTTEKKQVILIAGESGSGKSSLASRAEKQAQIHASCRFDPSNKEEHYIAIIACCQETCQRVLQEKSKNETRYHTVCQSIKTELLDIEVHLLSTAVPMLKHLDIDPTADDSSDDEVVPFSTSTSSPMDRWKKSDNKTEVLESVFCKFLQIGSLYFAPMVIHLDDLQYASSTDLAFLEKLLLDQRIQHSLILIGCYRSNEFTSESALAQTIGRLQARPNTVDLTQISLQNLSVSHTHQILLELLAMDDMDDSQDKNNKEINCVMDLAELCHRRTMGNIYFLLTFIRMLKENDLLEYNLNIMAWRWDLTKIEAETDATDNVVEIMKKRMTKSDSSDNQDMPHLFKLAACLGGALRQSLLGLLWEKLPPAQGNTTTTASAIEALLEKAVEESFLEKVSDETTDYRWAHDEVQEAAMSLVPEGEFEALQLRVGNTLLHNLSEKDLEASIFTVTNLLNTAGSLEPSIDIAKMNLRAATKAAGMSAFSSSEKYAEMGVSFLPSDVWETSDSGLALELYSSGAEASGGLGNLEKMESFCQVVLRNPEVPIMDQLRCYNVLIEFIGKRKRPTEAMNLAMDVLGELGCKFPRGSFGQTVQAIAGLQKMRKNKEITNVEKMLQIPLMTDPVKIEIMKLMEKVALYAYLSKSSMVYLIATVNGVKWTLRHGLAEESPSFAFCSLGILLMHLFGDWKTGPRYAEIGLSMIDKLDKKYMVSAVTMVAQSFLLCWVHPWSSRIKLFMEGYEKGMQVGDTEFATHNLGSYLFSSFVSGKSLELVDQDFEHFVPQIEMLQNLEQAAWVRIYWQAILNLMGKDDNTTLLSGSAMEESEFEQHLEAFQSKQQLVGLKTFQSYLCVIFGDHKRGAALALERGDTFLKDAPGLSVTMLDPFVRGMSLYAMAQKTKRRKYRVAANSARATIASWAEKGNVNVVHQLKLLNAEKAALSQKDRQKVSAPYEEAIQFAIRCGCIQDAALANERYGEYLLGLKVPDHDGAVYYFKAAATYYKDWGASRKVEMLEMKYPGLLQGGPKHGKHNLNVT